MITGYLGLVMVLVMAMVLVLALALSTAVLVMALALVMVLAVAMVSAIAIALAMANCEVEVITMNDKKITYTPDQLMGNSISVVNLLTEDLYRKLHRIGQYEGPEYKKLPYDELIKRAENLQKEIIKLVVRCVRAKEKNEGKEE